MRLVLFDLDDTLAPDEEAAAAAFLATARVAATRHPVDAARLAGDARTRARELWRAAPTSSYCTRVGISSWEGLWCGFAGDAPPVRALRRWAPTYRRQAWRRALADQGVCDHGLAEELAERFVGERRVRQRPFDDVPAALAGLAGSYRLAVVTNGASCLQREKLDYAGLADRFDVIVVSADVGVGKPDPAVFRHALQRLGAANGRAVMVGDSLARDVDGAEAAGLAAIWVNRARRARPDGRRMLVEIRSLAELAGALARV